MQSATDAEEEVTARTEEGESEFHDAAFTKRGCCFWLPCFMKWNRIGREGEREEWWGLSLLMKVREWSEIAAGPKWKTFIRRFRKNRFRPGASKFRYDPLSYALNFDESAIQSTNSCEEELLRRDFSVRYALIPAASARSSIHIGRDASTPLSRIDSN